MYLVGSVVAAAAVNPLLARFGPRASYLLTLAIFGVGTSACALAPTMELLLVARTVQGAAGGMLAGLGYAVINSALPSWLWTRASALVSAMWGVSVIIGPAMGGIFAQFGIWRWAFGSLVILTAAMAVLVPGALPARQPSDRRAVDPSDPGVVAAAARRRSAGDQRRGRAASRRRHRRPTRAGVGLVVLFLVVDRRAKATVLPRAAFGPGPLKWMYVTIGLLMAATMVDMYVPLFGQRLAGMVPAAAGFFGAVLAVGWTSSRDRERIRQSDLQRSSVWSLVSPVVMALGLALGALVLGSHLTWPLVVALGGRACSSPESESVSPGRTCRRGSWVRSTIRWRRARPRPRSTPCS